MTFSPRRLLRPLCLLFATLAMVAVPAVAQAPAGSSRYVVVLSGSGEPMLVGGPLRGFLGTTFSEAKGLVGAWGKGTFPTLARTIAYHFAEHGEEVGTKSALQYLRKAYEFNRNLRGAEKALLENGATRYTKNGYYIIKNAEGHILSYGVAR